MENRHWSEEEFVGRLYGIASADDHIEACAACKRRWELYLKRRESLRMAAPEIPADILAAQRRAVLARLDEKPRQSRLELLPSFAAILLILVIVTIFRPAPKPLSVDTAPDTELYQDVFSMVSRTAPTAVEPLRSLFEVQQ